MEYIIISDLEDRLIKLGWSRGKRYADEVAKGSDPWWDFHVIIKKPGIDCDYISESMTERELLSLLALIQKSRDFESDREEKTEFMEPDYDFIVSKHHGILQVYLDHTDSLRIWLEREHLDAIEDYLKKALRVS